MRKKYGSIEVHIFFTDKNKCYFRPDPTRGHVCFYLFVGPKTVTGRKTNDQHFLYIRLDHVLCQNDMTNSA